MKPGLSHEVACGSCGCVNTSRQYFLIISIIEVNTKYNSETIDTRSMKKGEVRACTRVRVHTCKRETHWEKVSPTMFLNRPFPQPIFLISLKLYGCVGGITSSSLFQDFELTFFTAVVSETWCTLKSDHLKPWILFNNHLGLIEIVWLEGLALKRSTR